MNDLIRINYDAETPTVSGRELHEALGVETRYNDWFKRMCEYGFSEGEDFYSFLSKTPEGGRPATDHALSIPMAKELCMLQRTEKGKQCRQYFIKVEEKWNSPEAIMSRALKIADMKLLEAQNAVKQLEIKVEQDKPKVIFADAVSASKSSILIGELAKILKQNGVDTGQKRLFQWMRDNGYLMKSGSSRNMPTQRSMDKELFEIKETTVTHADGHIAVNKTVKCTGKGQVYFINLLAGGVNSNETDHHPDDCTDG